MHIHHHRHGTYIFSLLLYNFRRNQSYSVFETVTITDNHVHVKNYFFPYKFYLLYVALYYIVLVVKYNLFPLRTDVLSNHDMVMK